MDANWTGVSSDWTDPAGNVTSYSGKGVFKYSS